MNAVAEKPKRARKEAIRKLDKHEEEVQAVKLAAASCDKEWVYIPHEIEYAAGVLLS